MTTLLVTALLVTPLLVTTSACGGTPERPPVSSGIIDPDEAVVTHAGELCPRTTDTRYVLYYNAASAEIYPQHEGSFPVGGQQITVCVINADFRDVYRVGTTDEIALDSGQKGPAFEVGPPVPEAFEATTRVRESQAVSLERQCGGRNIANTVALIEQLRSELLEQLREAFEEPMVPADVRRLQESLQALRAPRDSRYLCSTRPEDAAEEGSEGPSPGERREEETGVEARCSLEQYINFYALPDWLWLVGGQIYLDIHALEQAGCASSDETEAFRTEGEGVGLDGRVPADQAQTLIPPNMQPLLVSLLRAMAKASALVEFSESIFSEMNPPQRVFDLGSFDDDRLVLMRVSRHRRVIEYENGTLRSAWRPRVTTRRQEVHGLTYFRVEPGFVFSALRRPDFSIGPNEIGDRVLRLDDDGLRVFHPAVLLSFYWCGLDLRYSPFRRVCHAHQDSWLGYLLPLLPTPAIGIPIDDTLVTGTGSVFLGGVLNWFPYVSIGIGAHLGLNIRTLRDGYRVGDPVPFETGDLDAVTERSVQAAPYISITVANDAFEALRGFEAAR
ncbi:MAG: hypothetical protein AAGF12_34145 [Myxococcota bacterium]